MASPKIAFVHFYTFRLLRGIETLIISLANEVAKLGAEAAILTASSTVKPLVEPHQQVHVFQFSVPRYFARFFIAPQYVWNLARHNYDYVFFFFADFGEGDEDARIRAPLAYNSAARLFKLWQIIEQ